MRRRCIIGAERVAPNECRGPGRWVTGCDVAAAGTNWRSSAPRVSAASLVRRAAAFVDRLWRTARLLYLTANAG
jgi:hypothetical protein